MLPAADLHTRCLRCGAGLRADQPTCPACNADPAIERWVYAYRRAAILDLTGLCLAGMLAGSVAIMRGHPAGLALWATLGVASWLAPRALIAASAIILAVAAIAAATVLPHDLILEIGLLLLAAYPLAAGLAIRRARASRLPRARLR